MIEDSFEIYGWNIRMLYECTCDDINYIIQTLRDINCPNKYIKEAINNIESCNINIGLTYSNYNLKSSVIVISKTSTFSQLINSVTHEFFHLVSHISLGLKIYEEEELATLMGDLNMRSYKIIKNL